MVRIKVDSHKGSRSCLDYRTRCGSSSIHTRAHALVLTPAHCANQVRFTQGLMLLSCLPHMVRIKFNQHKGSCSCLDFRTWCGLSSIHTRAHALVLTSCSMRVEFNSRKGSRSCLDSSTWCGSSSIHSRAHALVLTPIHHGADQVIFTQGLTLIS